MTLGLSLAWLMALLGLVGSVITLILLWRQGSEYRRIARTPTTPIASTPSGRLVEIQGTVVPSEQGVVQSPLTGRQVVRYTIDVRSSDGVTTVGVPQTFRESREFWVRDDFGSYARIPSGTAYLGCTQYGTIVTAEWSALPCSKLPLTPHVIGWARAVTGVERNDWCVQEWMIAPGDRLYVLGWAERAPDGTLVFRNEPDRGREVLLSTLSESELLRASRRGAALRAGGLLVFVMLTVGALLVVWELR